MESTISRKAVGGDGGTRKEFNQSLIKSYGSDMRKLLSEFWRNRWLTVNAYKEVNVTGRWADYQNNKRYSTNNRQEKQKEKSTLEETCKFCNAPNPHDCNCCSELQQNYCQTHRKGMLNANHAELTCDKTKEPPCHLAPSAELCIKCPLNANQPKAKP